jgi:hypothetical protein
VRACAPGFKASRSCGPEFAARGCRSCLAFFGDGAARDAHVCPFAHHTVRPQ